MSRETVVLGRRLDAVIGRLGSVAILAGLFAVLMGAAPATSQAACATVTPPATLAVAPPTEANPTRRCTSVADLDDLLRSDFSGTVLIATDANWEMRDREGRPLRDIPLRSGITLLGERGPLGTRPLLFAPDKRTAGPLFTITGNDVHVEGLHLRGPMNNNRTDIEIYVHGIRVVQSPEERLGRNVVIADNEFDQFTGAAVEVRGTHGVPLRQWNGSWQHLLPQDAGLVRVERNYMHHNTMDNGGYGVSVGGGAYATVEGNVFDYNRHAVAADGNAYSGYLARFNYVLQGGYKQDRYYNQHFDVHGDAGGGYGGYGGTYFSIASNTVRGEQNYAVTKTRPALMLRGRPVMGMYFTRNVLAHDDLGEAISLKGRSGVNIRVILPASQSQFNFHDSGNRYRTDYSAELAAGDFDGDGRTDVFVANGTAWFFSRAAIRPWEYLRPSGERFGDLGFADVDNDGATDVLSRSSTGRVAYYRGGKGALVSLTSAPVPMSELRFGDFDGDHKTDLFYTRGGLWYVWYGRTRSWTRVGGSSLPLSAFLFGEFDAVPGTDVAAVTSGMWAYSSAATQPWARLNARLARSFALAVAADFDGNGRTDIAVDEGQRWRYSRDGRGPLTLLRQGRWFPPLKLLPIGRFDGGTRDMVVAFEQGRGPAFNLGESLLILRGPGSAFSVRSSQNMR